MDGNAEVILDVCDWDTEELSTVLADILSVSQAKESAGKKGVELKRGVWEDPTAATTVPFFDDLALCWRARAIYGQCCMFLNLLPYRWKSRGKGPIEVNSYGILRCGLSAKGQSHRECEIKPECNCR